MSTLTVHLIHRPKPAVSLLRRHQPWRWKAVAANGKTVAVSGEHYTNRADCLAAIRLVFGDGQPLRLREVLPDGLVMTTAVNGAELDAADPFGDERDDEAVSR